MSNKNPVYLLAGGRPRNPQTPDPLIQEIIRKSGEKSPFIAYTGTANSDNEDFFNHMNLSSIIIFIMERWQIIIGL